MILSIEYYRGYLSDFKGTILELLIIILIILGILFIILFLYKRYLVCWSHKKEFWLPVVNEAGNVIGRVARSISFEKPHLYQHPLIRILVIKSGAIFLTPRTSAICPDFGKYDYPFERMMRYGESVEDTIKDLQKNHFPKSQKPDFVLKYKHENNIGTWQVLLYLLNVADEKELINIDKNKSKFWPIQQIEDNKGKSCFSALLESELDFMKTLIEIIE